ncbi:MAG: TonB-dependent receptor, partial [Bacteroidetes bacterium]
NVKRVIATASVDYRFWFLPDLRANMNVSYDNSKGEGTVDIPGNASFAFNPDTGGGVDNEYSETKRNELFEFYLNYGKEAGPHKFDLMAGYSWQRFFFDKHELNADIAHTPGIVNEKFESGELFLLSLYGRLNYSFQNKYLLTLTLRRDASSRFSPDKRWGLFPAAALAWKVIEGGTGTVNNLKLRLGYGVTGQQDIGNFYQYLPRYTFSLDNARYQFGDEFVTTLRPEGYDANIQWEETTTYNVGLDYGILDDRISGAIEFYIRKTDGLLNRVPIPAGTNLTNFLDTNVGSLENKGVEITINATPVRTAQWRWDVGVNVTRNKNEITKLIASDDPNFLGVKVGGIAGGVGSLIQIHSVGYPASSFFVFEQVYDQNGLPVEGLYVDRTGDGVVNSDDMYQYKNPAPDVFLGFNTNVSYGNFDFSLAGRANLGGYVYNNVQSTAAWSNLYHPNNFLINLPTSINETQFQNPQFFSDHFVQNGSFLRLDHITASYRAPALFDNKINATFSATLQNPLLITDYIGLDPEVVNGIDNNIYPRTRTFLIGVNASF